MALAASARCLPALESPALKIGENLIPETPCAAPNYWCTWAVQNYMYGHHLVELSPEILEGDSGSRLAHNAMNEQVLLGNGGWAHTFFPRIRKDLYLMLDDGWESQSRNGRSRHLLHRAHHGFQAATSTGRPALDQFAGQRIGRIDGIFQHQILKFLIHLAPH